MTAAAVPGLVSVVVASYHHARFLDRRMESLLAQTYEQIEIIVIDDRSPDNSVEVLRKYAAHPKVRLVEREENGGWVTVSNQGAELARGEFLLFANCDDACDPRMIERLVAGIRDRPTISVSYCRSRLVDENDRTFGDDFAIRERAFRVRCANDTMLTGAEMRRFLIDSCVIPNLSAALMRRDRFRAAGALTHEYRVCCDWDLFFRMFRTDDAYYVTEALNDFRHHATTIRSSTKDRVIYAEYLRLLLAEVRRLDVSALDRLHARRQVMSLWALHLIAPSFAGLRDLRLHLGIVRHIDPAALLLLPAAFVRRVSVVVGKLFTGRINAGVIA